MVIFGVECDEAVAALLEPFPPIARHFLNFVAKENRRKAPRRWTGKRRIWGQGLVEL